MKARSHDFLRGISFNMLFYRLLEANIEIQKRISSLDILSAPSLKRDEL